MRLANQVALISGAGGPMGLAIAKRFASEGARVVITDISASRLQAGVSHLCDLGIHADSIVAQRADVTQRDEAAAVVAGGIEKFGQIDILVNVVGGYQGRDYQGPQALTQMSETRWDSTFNLNLKPIFHFVQLLAPAMSARGAGKIINVASINMAGEAGSADYGAAKAAVASCTRTLAIELAPHINANCIAPGIIRTRVLAMVGEEVAEEYRQRSLLKRLGEPEDIANAALFLASEESSYITGEMLPVAGGIWPAL